MNSNFEEILLTPDVGVDKFIQHEGCYDHLAILLKERPDLDKNGIGMDGSSPLHVAVTKSWPDCAELLLSHGASPNTL